MKRIAVITSTRADYGLLYPIIKEFRTHESKSFQLALIVTGTHLAANYGHTINEILEDNIRVDYTIKCSVNSKTENDIAENISDTIKKFTALFISEKFDFILILGDRYEILGTAISAMICRIPIFHISGGDTTEGAIDESIRHAITKMSLCHFTTNEISRKRVIQMGEDPQRVYNVGSTSVDNILREQLLDKKDALKSIGLDDCKFIICTYHPVTLDRSSALNDIKILITVLEQLNIDIIVTKSNSDLGGEEINQYLDKISESHKKIHVYSSLGRLRYLSLMKWAECIIGNSSSGIVEAPALKVMTINIGDRQKGRLQSVSVINAKMEKDDLNKKIKFALSSEGKQLALSAQNPYGKGDSAKQIVDISFKWLEKDLDLKKEFRDFVFPETEKQEVLK